jgi:DNA helicase-2/ATP-dependent DNA helicase PcrA
MEDHLFGLNAKQKEAATHINGPLLIVAGAGAGKTKTITHRILNLIKNGVAPEKILAVTFTNKAAKEMQERVNLLMSRSFTSSNFSSLRPSPDYGVGTLGKLKIERSEAPFISTFHSLGVYIIKENARILGLTRHFTILDESDSTTLIKEAIKEIGLDPKQYEPKKIGNIISREKGKFTNLEHYEEKVNDPAYREGNYLSKIVAQVWNLYEKKKAKENSLDFDDLLLKATKLLKENEQIRKIYQEKWDYIHIDEYQDTNEVQYLMSKLLSENNKNICVVGDADQNIYSWRGANLKNILSFEKDYGKDVKIILLEENYRSTKNILEAANEIIKKINTD